MELTWQLKNLLFLYDDIAELNWQPLTDSSESIEKFEFHVRGDKGAENLFFHTGQLFREGRIEQSGPYYTIRLDNPSVSAWSRVACLLAANRFC